MTEYRALSETPPLVQRALALARQHGFEKSSLAEVGRLLQLFASQRRSGTLGEIGTGCGVGAAWIVSGMQPGLRFVTVELDAARASLSSDLLADCSGVQVLQGDWRQILEHGPFGLLFVDAAAAKQHETETLLQALEPGGVIIFDDLTPLDQWPAAWQGHPDPLREFWLNDQRVRAIELRVQPASTVIIAVRAA